MRQTLVMSISTRARLLEKLRALKARDARLAARKAQGTRQNLPLAS